MASFIGLLIVVTVASAEILYHRPIKAEPIEALVSDSFQNVVETERPVIKRTNQATSVKRQVSTLEGGCTSAAQDGTWWWTADEGGFKMECTFKTSEFGGLSQATKITACRLSNKKELAVGETGTEDDFCPYKCEEKSRPFPNDNQKYVTLSPAGQCIAPEGQGVCHLITSSGESTASTRVSIPEGETKQVGGLWYKCERQLDGSVKYTTVSAPKGEGVCNVRYGNANEQHSVKEGETREVSQGHFYVCERQLDGSFSFVKTAPPKGEGVCSFSIGVNGGAMRPISLKEGEIKHVGSGFWYKCERTADGAVKYAKAVAPAGEGVCTLPTTTEEFTEGEVKEVARGTWYKCERQPDGSLAAVVAPAPAGKASCHHQGIVIKEGEEKTLGAYGLYTCARNANGIAQLKKVEVAPRCKSATNGYDVAIGEFVNHQGKRYDCKLTANNQAAFVPHTST